MICGITLTPNGHTKINLFFYVKIKFGKLMKIFYQLRDQKMIQPMKARSIKAIQLMKARHMNTPADEGNIS